MNTIKIRTNEQNKGMLKVAFATSDLKNINSHFGKAEQFAVYNISEVSNSFCEIIKVSEKDTDETVALLKGIDILYFTNIGSIAAAKVVNSGIFPIKYKTTVSIEEEIQKLTFMLNDNPPPFIKKIIEKKAS